MENLRGFQGIFFNEETEELLKHMQKEQLSTDIKNMHITFYYGDLERFPDEYMMKDISVEVIGYASDGKNSGFEVKLPENLKKLYKSKATPHITVSIGEKDGVKGKPVDTGKLKFLPLEKNFEINGRLGYSVFDKGLCMDNKEFDEWERDIKENHSLEEVKDVVKDRTMGNIEKVTNDIIQNREIKHYQK